MDYCFYIVFIAYVYYQPLTHSQTEGVKFMFIMQVFGKLAVEHIGETIPMQCAN
jgi:hypothetical protein